MTPVAVGPPESEEPEWLRDAAAAVGLPPLPSAPVPESPVATPRSWADAVESEDDTLPPLPEAEGVVIQQEDEDWTPVVSKKGRKRR
jgi:hypothetical protein